MERDSTVYGGWESCCGAGRPSGELLEEAARAERHEAESEGGQGLSRGKEGEPSRRGGRVALGSSEAPGMSCGQS